MHTDLDVVCIDKEDVFRDLISDWNRLAVASGQSSIFLRHEWFDASWEWLKSECVLRIVCIRKNDAVIGICPLIRYRRRINGMKVRVIEFLSIPDTQLCDLLVAASDHQLVVDALVEHLLAVKHEWDMINLQKLPSGSLTPDALSVAMRKHMLQTKVRVAASNPGLSLIDEWQVFYARRSRRLKKGNNLVANRLKRTYKKIDLDWIRGVDVDPRSVDNAMQIAITLSSRSWKKETGLTLENAGPGAFVRTLTRHAQKQGWLSLWILYLDGIPVAMEYQLAYNGHVHALRADFDMTYEESSPGTYLNWKILEALFNEDLMYYHMGPGDNPYKIRWAEDHAPLYQLIVFGTTVRGRILGLLEGRLRPIARRIIKKSTDSD